MATAPAEFGGSRCGACVCLLCGMECVLAWFGCVFHGVVAEVVDSVASKTLARFAGLRSHLQMGHPSIA
eukprot:1158975-Pelagomonas_calceolata.AAC.34